MKSVNVNLCLMKWNHSHKLFLNGNFLYYVSWKIISKIFR